MIARAQVRLLLLARDTRKHAQTQHVVRIRPRHLRRQSRFPPDDDVEKRLSWIAAATTIATASNTCILHISSSGLPKHPTGRCPPEAAVCQLPPAPGSSPPRQENRA